MDAAGHAAVTIGDRLVAAVGAAHVDLGDAVDDDASHDEALGIAPVRPAGGRSAGVDRTRWRPSCAAAGELGVPVTARGSGTGLSGAAVPVAGGIVVSFERMDAILEIDVANQVAVVEPGVTLADLDAALAPSGWCTRCSPASSRPASAATCPPTPAACGRSSTASPATTSSASRRSSAPAR